MTTEDKPVFKGTYYEIDGAINQPKPLPNHTTVVGLWVVKSNT